MLRSAFTALMLALGITILPSDGLTAQARTPGLGHDVPTSTRGMALGGAYMMDAEYADAVFVHPSLLRGASGMTLDVQRWGSASGSMSAAAATSWFNGSIGVGIGVQAMQHGYAAATGSRVLDPSVLAVAAGRRPGVGAGRRPGAVTHLRRRG
jgi:hypothetical protein